MIDEPAADDTTAAAPPWTEPPADPRGADPSKGRALGRRATRLVTARPWVSAAVAVVVAGGVAGAVLLTGGDDSSATQAGTTTSLVAASTGTVRATVSTTGTITAADSHDVDFPVAAEVTSVKVAQGDKVTKGQVLGTIDSLALKATLADAKADLANARSTLADAEADSSSTDAQITADTTAVTTAKAAVATATTNLADATLRSPITGTVAEVGVTAGEQSSGAAAGSSSSSSAGGTTGTGTATTGSGGTTTSGSGGGATASSSSSSSSSADFVVIGLKKWTVSASVDDTQVGLVKRGDQVQITTDNVQGTVFGTVSSVSVLSSSDSSGSASYPVDIAVTGSPTGLHDGASATAAIVYKQATNVVTVPTAAVRTDGSTSYVTLSQNGKQTKRTVTTGLSSGGTTQITSGLAAGQQVVVQTIVPARTGTGGTTTGGTTTGGTQRGTGGYFPGGGAGGFGGGTGGFPGGTGGLPGGAGGSR